VYLRRTRVRKNGKWHAYWLLVRSVRQGRRVRQEIVARLGRLDARGRRRAQSLADRITARRCHPTLFEPPDREAEEVAEVKLKGVKLDRSRRFGDVFLGPMPWAWLALGVMAAAANLMLMWRVVRRDGRPFTVATVASAILSGVGVAGWLGTGTLLTFSVPTSKLSIFPSCSPRRPTSPTPALSV